MDNDEYTKFRFLLTVSRIKEPFSLEHESYALGVNTGRMLAREIVMLYSPEMTEEQLNGMLPYVTVDQLLEEMIHTAKECMN